MHPSAKTKDFHGGEKGQFFPDFFLIFTQFFFKYNYSGVLPAKSRAQNSA